MTSSSTDDDPEGTASDVARAVRLLVSDPASCVTAQVLAHAEVHPGGR